MYLLIIWIKISFNDQAQTFDQTKIIKFAFIDKSWCDQLIKFNKLFVINIANQSPAIMILTGRNVIALGVVILVACLSGVQAEVKFEKRNSFSLGPNVITAKFSPDYTLLAVLRSGQKYLDSYDPMTFELIGSHKLQNDVIPIDLEMFGTDIIVAAQPNVVQVYQRKVGSSQLILKQNKTLKYKGILSGLKLQRLKEDINDKSSPNSTRHLAVWHKNSFEVFKYVASQDGDKLSDFTNRSFEATGQTITDMQFLEQKFMVFGLQSSATTGETQLISLTKPTTITKVNSKLSFSIKQYMVRSLVIPGDHYFMAVSQQDGVGQFKPQAKNIKQGEAITNISAGYGFYDNNNMIGFHNGSSIVVFRSNQILSTGSPKYVQKLSESKTSEQPSITIASMPQKDTGQLIINNCFQNNQLCFYYYSICPADTYYNISPLGQESCKKCNITNCAKCLNDECVMCGKGYWVNNKKCQPCSNQVYGCNSCTQNGKNCHSCDNKEFSPLPVNNVCQCLQGNVYDLTNKKCVSCQKKISYCSTCTLGQDQIISCNECQQNINRILNNDSKSCICNPDFYFENSTNQCQLCDSEKKCLHCTNTGLCTECDSSKKWILNEQSKCVCLGGYVDISNQCELCSKYITGCNTCSEPKRCKICDSTLNRNLTPTDQGKCVCQASYTENSQDLCVLCTVAGCSNCQTENVCTLCDTSLNRKLTPTDGKCICQSNYTENSHEQCVLCTEPGCLKCQSENMCSTCDSSKGFNETITDGKCQCLATKYLDTTTCKDCSTSLLGCQLCSKAAECEKCNTTLNFDSKPVNGSCKCLANYFVMDNQCLQCQIICEHCQKCVYIVSQDELLSTSVGCSQCEDGYEIQDSRCIQKGSSAWVFILIGIGALTVVIVIGVCYLKKKRSKKQEDDRRKSKSSQASLVSMLLKQNDPQFLTSERTQPGAKKQYQPLFSGNINYSISSEQRQGDKKAFNQTMKQLQRQRKEEFERKNRTSNYGGLSKNININKKPAPTEEEIQDKKRQSLFSHRVRADQPL